MFLFILFFAIILSGCTTIEAPYNNQNNKPYYTHQSQPLTKSYITSQKNIYSAGKGTFAWPMNGRVINNYGQWSGGTSNKGINIQANNNEAVHAASDGQIVFANHVKGWGQTVIVAHKNNIYTVYANLKSVTVKEGSPVRKGEIIAQAAQATNRSSLLHFEVRSGHQAQNPMRYLS